MLSPKKVTVNYLPILDEGDKETSGGEHSRSIGSVLGSSMRSTGWGCGGSSTLPQEEKVSNRDMN